MRDNLVVDMTVVLGVIAQDGDVREAMMGIGRDDLLDMVDALIERVINNDDGVPGGDHVLSETAEPQLFLLDFASFKRIRSADSD